MQVSRTAYRASLLFLNPLLARASLASCPSANSPALRHLTPSAQLHSLLFPQCSPTFNFKQPDLIREAHTMAIPDSASNTNNPSRETKPEEQTQEQAQADSTGEHLYLPASSGNENNEKGNGEGQQHRLSLNDDAGSTVTLDHLGPMVVNTDGTLSRISNWEHMTEIEKKNTMRILGKRNKQRLEAVKAAEQGGK
ncbi:hypothetical protein N7474_008710 [Penicillium riverlandense]|uniref:uncharacterized protein n=1 Tax=Penicillium riverlandense TaxID=1903569 RepID=UPI0025499F11|nr:uncharacterized protein N7474_008710 [Penicillium riverlandense]KAJ5812409.1 hypothetical protein N7474_008710 [Penicillium riverlandense]